MNTTENDLKILQRTGTKVVHNPLANTILGSGMPPILKMLEHKIPVCFSTDGSGSADNQNILSAARLASQYQKAFNQDASVINAEEALKRITSVAAQILKHDSKLRVRRLNWSFGITAVRDFPEQSSFSENNSFTEKFCESILNFASSFISFK